MKKTSLWNYIDKYFWFALAAAIFMVCEVAMDLAQPSIMRKIVDDGVLGLENDGVGNMRLIISAGILMIGIALFGGICGCMNNVFVNISGQSVGNDIRKDCFRSIMRFSFPQVEAFGTGALVTHVTNDVTRVQDFISLMVRGMIRTGLLFFGSLFCMYTLNPRFGHIVLITSLLTIGFIAICVRKVNPLFPKLQEQLDQLNSMMQEDISGIRLIKACLRELWEKSRFGKANDALICTNLRVMLVFAAMHPVVHAMMYLVIAGLLVVGKVDAQSGNCSPGSIMAAITYTTQLLHSVVMVVMIFQNITRGMTSWKRLKGLLETEPEIKDGSGWGAEQPPAAEQTRGAKIEFRDVSFAYVGSKRNVLEHISFTVQPGESLAIMGAIGCGKSSLVNLIPRFYDVTAGMILLNDRDVREYPVEMLRKKMGIALQKSELFRMTIGENIAWGKENSSAGDIQRAIRISQAEEFIVKLANGLDSEVAERGMSLSGGQRQRIALARAVIRNAEILIFDDATSALDLRTEAALFEALRQECPDATRIIVAQRIASVKNADRILILEHGGIAGIGSHAELLRTCPAYQAIYDSQYSEEEG